eukprot:4522037-Alexandrium_andersonii.AAC.1
MCKVCMRAAVDQPTELRPTDRQHRKHDKQQTQVKSTGMCEDNASEFDIYARAYRPPGNRQASHAAMMNSKECAHERTAHTHTHYMQGQRMRAMNCSSVARQPRIRLATSDRRTRALLNRRDHKRRNRPDEQQVL